MEWLLAIERQHEVGEFFEAALGLKFGLAIIFFA
jgi:hypothetical protein